MRTSAASAARSRRPNLDALAAVGVRFTQFTASATCSPSRSMLLTGTDNHVAGLGNMAEFMAPNQDGKPGYEGYLNDRVAVLPELLADAGYDTFMAGKWHMGEEPEHWPAARGFQRDLTLIPGGGSHLDDMWGATGERQPYTYNGELLRALRPGFHSSVDYTAAIIDNIEEHRGDGKPFFAYLALQAPHDPFQLPADWRDRYAGRYDQGYDARARRPDRADEDAGHPRARRDRVSPPAEHPRLGRPARSEKRQESARRMELYAAMVEHMDANIGELIGYLKTTGLYDNTLIFFMSDNGPEGNLMQMGAAVGQQPDRGLGQGGDLHPVRSRLGAGQRRAAPLLQGLRDRGRHPRAPDRRGRGRARAARRIEDGVAHVMDIPATILDAAGVTHPGS